MVVTGCAGNDQGGTDDKSVAHGVAQLDRQVRGSTQVANGGDARLHHRARMPRHAQQHACRAIAVVDLAPLSAGVEAEVRMALDQARQHRAASDIDHRAI